MHHVEQVSFPLCCFHVNTETWSLESEPQCLLWCETVWTVAVDASLISNFRDSVSSINQILNQMCEDGYWEQFRTVKQAQTPNLLAGFSTHAAWSWHGQSRNWYWALNPQNPGTNGLWQTCKLGSHTYLMLSQQSELLRPETWSSSQTDRELSG